MAAGEYLTGLALLALVVGAALFGSVAIARRVLPSHAGVERLLAVALLATALLIAMHIVPAMLGILDRWVIAALAAGLIAAALLDSRRPAPTAASADPEPAEERSMLSRLAAFVAIGAVAVYAIAVLARLYETPPTFIDTVTFHLPGAVRWIQTESIWQIDQFLPGQAQGYYPGNGNVVQLAALLPWSSDFLIRFVNLPFYALTGLAVYASGIRLGAPRTSAAVAGAAAISVPAVTSYIVDSPTPDAVMYAGFAAGVLFLLRHAHSALRADLLLAGLGLGIAFGSRWYGVSSVAVVVVVWLGAQTVARRWTRRLAVDAALMAGTIALAGGIWLIRNWVEAGDPVFPVEVSVLGETLFSAPRDVVRELVGFSIAHYFDDWDVLSGFVFPGLKIQIGYVGVLLAAAVLVGVVLAARRGRNPVRVQVLALAAAALGLTVAYAVTPYTALGLEGLPYELGANVRYLIPALLVAAPVLAWVLARSGSARPVLELLVVAIAIDAMLRGVVVSAANVFVGAVGVAALAIAAVAIGRAFRRSALAGVAAAAVASVVVAGALYSIQDRVLEDRYVGFTPTLDLALEHASPGTEVGVAGAWPTTTISPILALFGTRFDNEVSYVGETTEGMLRPYETATEFTEALDRGGYELLMVGLNEPLGYPQLPEERWAQDAGWRKLAADDNFVLLSRSR